MHTILQRVQKQVHQSVGRAARKNWPTKPALQKVHTAFTVGLGNFQEKTELEKVVTQIDHLIAHQAGAFKKFLYTYQAPISLSRQIVYPLPDRLVVRILQFLDLQAYPFIQQYISFINPPPISFYQAHKIDVFSWRKQHELATLYYLLKKQDTLFDQEKYLVSTLNPWKMHHPQIQPMLAYHRQHDNTPTTKQLIHQVGTVLSLPSPLAESLEESMHQPADTPIPQVQVTENATKPQHIKPGQELKLYIKNSGLILIWPFIEELFNKQGLLEQRTL